MSPDEVRQARLDWGMGQAAFGRMFAVDDRTVRRWETGETEPPLPIVTLVRLALKHDVVRRELLGLPRG